MFDWWQWDYAGEQFQNPVFWVMFSIYFTAGIGVALFAQHRWMEVKEGIDHDTRRELVFINNLRYFDGLLVGLALGAMFFFFFQNQNTSFAFNKFTYHDRTCKAATRVQPQFPGNGAAYAEFRIKCPDVSIMPDAFTVVARTIGGASPAEKLEGIVVARDTLMYRYAFSTAPAGAASSRPDLVLAFRLVDRSTNSSLLAPILAVALQPRFTFSALAIWGTTVAAAIVSGATVVTAIGKLVEFFGDRLRSQRDAVETAGSPSKRRRRRLQKRSHGADGRGSPVPIRTEK